VKKKAIIFITSFITANQVRLAAFGICFFYLLNNVKSNTQSQDQSPKITCTFLSDSVLIGDEIEVSLTAKIPFKSVFFFPDSAYDYSPFVVKNFRWFPQRPNAKGESIDSMVYTLSIFTDSGFWYLKLPIFEVNPEGDTLIYYSNTDSILVHHVYPKTEVTEELAFMPLAHEINYPYIVSGVLLAFLVLFVLNLLLGKPIQRNWQLFLLWRRYKVYLQSFEKLKMGLIKSRHSTEMEKLLNLWKSFMQRTSGFPFNTYTTREIAAYTTNESLIQSLTEIDKWVYGGIEPDEKNAIIDQLADFSTQSYVQKRQSIKNERKPLQRN